MFGDITPLEELASMMNQRTINGAAFALRVHVDKSGSAHLPASRHRRETRVSLLNELPIWPQEACAAEFSRVLGHSIPSTTSSAQYADIGYNSV